jgi:hypothetical protein
MNFQILNQNVLKLSMRVLALPPSLWTSITFFSGRARAVLNADLDSP